MDSDFDYYQEIARSGFGDMLHDLERNNKYYDGIKKAIEKLRARNQEVHVLDIGTGSGLLSMMAIRLGADSATACEAFRPMADTAERIFEANGMQYRVNLIKRRSTDISVGPGQDMNQRANLLVTEVFDTELIGEGAIEIFNHAHEELLTPDCLVVPHLSRVYVQPVQSPFFDGFNRIKAIPNLDGEVLVRPPKKFQECPGTAFLFDIQLSQFHDRFQPAADPQVVMEFDFSGKAPIELERRSVKAFTPKLAGGTVQALLFWWDLLMDEEGDVVLSCAPSWSHPDFAQHRKAAEGSVQDKDVIPWRDHWMQAVYFPPAPLHITAGDDFYISSNHGEFSWWFTVAATAASIPDDVKECFCTCGLHQSCSRYRIGQMNYGRRNKAFLEYYEEQVGEGSTVMSITHGSLITLAATGCKLKALYMVDDSSLGNSLVSDFVKENRLDTVQIVSNADQVPLQEVTHVIGEPYFANNILPWHSFRFANILRRLSGGGRLREDVLVFPSKFSLYVLPVQLLHLHKIRYPMENINTFDVRELDRLLEHAYEVADDHLEPQSLIEYPCMALSEPVHVNSVELLEYIRMEGTPKLQFTVTAVNQVYVLGVVVGGGLFLIVFLCSFAGRMGSATPWCFTRCGMTRRSCPVDR